MARDPVWKSTGTLAWTEHDGPGRPPAPGSPALWLAMAGVLSVVFSTMIIAAVLCPDHRAWVQALGSVALFGTATATIALLRGWSSAPLITLATAAVGVVIGGIDAQHDPVRGGLIAVAFLLVVGSALLSYRRRVSLARWQRRTLAAADEPVAEPTEAPAAPKTPPIAQEELGSGRTPGSDHQVTTSR
jgi:hypothetical protein